MALDIGKQIAVLKQMTVRELREKYETVFGEPTRAGNKDSLFKRIAWRIRRWRRVTCRERARRPPAELGRDASPSFGRRCANASRRTISRPWSKRC